MDERSADKELIATFGAAIAHIHDRHVASVKETLNRIADPQTDYDRAIAAYHSGLTSDQLTVTLAQRAIEGVLHDLFFLFDEREEFKLVLKREDDSEIDLAQAVDVIQSFPMDWFEKASSAGHEGGRLVAFLSEKLDFKETRQEQRARILTEKAKNESR